MKKTLLLLGAACAVLLAAAPVAGQGFLLPETPSKGVWIEGSHSDFKGFEAKLPSSVWFLSGRLPLTQKLSGVVDVPFAHAKLDLVEVGAESNSVLGNPYVGIEYAAMPRLLVELGFRAPLTTAAEESFADALAAISDPLRQEAFVENLVPVTAAATMRFPLQYGVSLRARAGVTGLLFTGDEAPDNEAAIDYGLAGMWERGIGRVGVGFTGRWFATSDEGSFAENSLHHAGVSADVIVGGVRPGVSLRLPIDKDYREFVGPTVGLYLQVPLR
jgi:hypothetical protein